MTILVTALAALAFLAAFQLLGVVPCARSAIATSRQTAAVMSDSNLDDDAKETAVQKAAISLMKGFFGLVLRLLGVLVAAYVPIFLFDAVGLLPESAALAFMLRIDVIVATSVLVIAAIWIVNRVRKQ